MGNRILLVDDEPQLVYLVASRLKASGYEVLTAGDGQTALEMAKKERPDLVVLDLMLPRMDGFKVCGLLKKDSRYASIPIILFSAKAQESDREMGMEAGADAYITKPFDPELLLGKIQELTIS